MEWQRRSRTLPAPANPWYCERIVAQTQGGGGGGGGGGGPLPDTEEVPVGAGVGDNHVAEEPIAGIRVARPNGLSMDPRATIGR